MIENRFKSFNDLSSKTVSGVRNDWSKFSAYGYLSRFRCTDYVVPWQQDSTRKSADILNQFIAAPAKHKGIHVS